jgi:hypothetical protein
MNDMIVEMEHDIYESLEVLGDMGGFYHINEV